MSRKLNLTREQEQQILASIRMGGYPHVAAAAWGVADWEWENWRQRSTGKHARGRLRAFFRKVEEAHGQARLTAEIAALKTDPRSWLKHGPGRESPADPGWSTLAKPTPAAPGHIDFFDSPELLRFLANLRTTLAPHPAALDSFSKTLDDSHKFRHARHG